jgi:PKHD-type hydroxylase
MREVYKVWSSSLTLVQTEAIIAAALTQPAQSATIFSSKDAQRGIRSCTIRWLSDQWIKDLVWRYVKQANEEAFELDVQHRCELQYVEYQSSQDDHYDWHHDVDWNGQGSADRKLSVTVQLTNDRVYQGGDFEFDEIQTNADFRSRGTVLVFPSYLRHKIHPVTSGKRCALVAWFFGPRWR